MGYRGFLLLGSVLLAFASCGESREYQPEGDAAGASGDGGSSNQAGEGQMPQAGAADAGSGGMPEAVAGAGAGGDLALGGAGPEPVGGGGNGDPGDGGAAGAPVDPGPLTWCDERMPSASVAAADFKCLDFDEGLPPTGTWPQDVAGGSLALTELVASSSPNALRLTADSGDRARISWSRVGASKVLSVTVAADFNPVNFPAAPPPWPGSAEVMCVELGGGTACLQYKWGASGQDYFVRVVPSLVMMPSDCTMSASPAGGDWTRVELSALSTGQVLLKLNNVNVLSNCSNQFSTATSAKVTVGLNALNTSNAWTVNFDNVEASLAR